MIARESMFEDTAKWVVLPSGSWAGAKRADCNWRDYAPPPAPEFQQGDAIYHGVLIATDDGRLIVSPNGSKYTWQVVETYGFRDKNWRKSLAALAPFLPSDVAEIALERYPDNPANFVRPWADAMATASARWRSLNYSGDEYGAVLARHGSVRIVVPPCGSQYWLQIASRTNGWQVKRCADYGADLARAVVCDGDGWAGLSGVVVRSDRLAAAVAAFPEAPRDALPSTVYADRVAV